MLPNQKQNGNSKSKPFKQKNIMNNRKIMNKKKRIK